MDAQILEGTQLHKKDFDEDELFSTSVDVRAKFNDGAEVIIEIRVRKEPYFLNRFQPRRLLRVQANGEIDKKRSQSQQ